MYIYQKYIIKALGIIFNENESKIDEDFLSIESVLFKDVSCFDDFIKWYAQRDSNP